MVAVTLPAPDDTRDFGRFLRAQWVQVSMRVSWGVISFSPQDIGGAGLPYLVGLAATPCTPTILLEGYSESDVVDFADTA